MGGSCFARFLALMSFRCLLCIVGGRQKADALPKVLLGDSVGVPALGMTALLVRNTGESHNGPHELGILLCLCPNDYVRLDLGATVVTDDLAVISPISGAVLGKLRTNLAHWLACEYLAYHRGLWTGAAL